MPDPTPDPISVVFMVIHCQLQKVVTLQSAKGSTDALGPLSSIDNLSWLLKSDYMYVLRSLSLYVYLSMQ